MKKFLHLIIISFALYACESFSKKADKISKNEEEKLNKFLGKTESELKIEFGKPETVELIDNQNRVLIFYDSKFKIKCERKFEINSKDKVIGFISKNCF